MKPGISPVYQDFVFMVPFFDDVILYLLSSLSPSGYCITLSFHLWDKNLLSFFILVMHSNTSYTRKLYYCTVRNSIWFCIKITVVNRNQS